MVTVITKSVMQLSDVMCVNPRNYQKLYSDCSVGFPARYAKNRLAAMQYWPLSYMITRNFYAEKASVV
jgi:hypothetical protein